MRQVLVIAYYFPPLGLSGVQRIAGFVRHLPTYGWQPTVLTVRPGGYFAHDQSLLAPIEDMGIRVIRTRSIDPTRLYRSGTTVKFPKESKRRILSSLSNWIFVPDNKLGWLPFALTAGLRQASMTKFNAILSSAPPYTCHIIGKILARRLRIPLITDFRDDWVGNPLHIYPSKLHQSLHLLLERSVLQSSSKIMTINSPILEALTERHREMEIQGEVIPHGFDERMKSARKSNQMGKKLKLVYTGVFYDTRKPDYFLHGLSAYLEENPSMRKKMSAIFAGLVPHGFRDQLRSLKLEDIVEYVGYLDHSGVLQLQQKADVLWMTIGNRPGSSGISTGKLFEYMGTQKPILALVPEGVARQTLEQYGAAYFAERDRPEEITSVLHQLVIDWKANNFPGPNTEFISRFSRSCLTRTLSKVLDSVSY